MKNAPGSIFLSLFFSLLCFFAVDPAFAAVAKPPALDSGATSWMLVSTILVLMMTIPGLALFYGGMVHKESVLATLMQAFVTTTLVSVLWCVYGYSLIFTEHSGFLGSLDKIMMHGIGVSTLTPA